MISKKLTGLLLAVIIILGLLVRVYALSKAPPSLYWDEMDVGYQAYSILKTGKDYFGNQPFLTVHSFADFRAPLLIYLTIPFVALIGLSSVSVRLPAAILGTLTILLIFILVNLLFKDRKTALFAAALTAFAPWEIQYSRMAFEAILLLVLFLGGLIFFFKGLINPKWFILASILFSINLFTYNTAKLFEPITLFILGVIYFPNLRKILFTRNLIISVVIFSITFLASLYGTVFLNGGQRFSEISVFTDPQTSSQIDFLRQESRSAYDETTLLGEQPRFLDKLIYNKITFQLDRVIENYFQVFSTEFLFIKGDPNLRHSTSYTGEFYRIEILTMIAGIIFLLFNFKKDKQKTLFLFAWIITAPLAAIVTREGGNHASRLFLLFPVLTIVSSLGLKQIYEMTFTKLKFFPLNKIIFSGIALIWIFGVISFLNFYFGAYKLSSERAFQYGFNEAVTKAIESKNSYDYVVMDNKGDTALMNYLFVSKYDPNLFQKNLPNMKSRFFDFDADQIDNIVMLKPGARNWEIIFNINLIDKDYLLIISAEQLEEQSSEKVNKKLTTNQKLLDVIRYKSGEPAFYVISSHKEIAI